MPNFRTILAVGSWSAAHFVVALAAVFVSLLFGDHAMEGPPATSSGDMAWSITHVLMSPGLQIALRLGIHNDAAEWALMVGNSVVWGTALFWLARFMRSLGRSSN